MSFCYPGCTLPLLYKDTFISFTEHTKIQAQNGYSKEAGEKVSCPVNWEEEAVECTEVGCQ